MGILHAQQAGALDGGVIGGIQPQLAVEQQLRRWLRPLLITRMGLLREALREAEKAPRVMMFSDTAKWRWSCCRAPKVEQVVDVDVEAVAQRDKVRETDFALLCPVENGVGHGGGLRNKRQLALLDRHRRSWR